MSENKFYLTTPIYYVNARPHIGHAYTTIVADVLARRHRLLGDDTFFLTGTDEHGQKIERSAAAAGIPPQQFADRVSKSFEDLWKRMGITHDDYIRTTDPRHKRGVQKLFSTLYEKGFIYLAKYTGAYCVSDEAFVDAPVGTPCPDCGRLLEEVTEENFFFKLSEFGERIAALIESNELLITPDTRRNEVLSFVKGGLKDLSISRSSFTWGIPVPEPAASAAAQKHVIYVWLDALANYMTALGYGSDDETLFEKFWPADLHLVGKEIIRFHCVYWPAFLLAADLPLPKQITAHGWLLFDNSKMSKSKGNIVRTETILDAFGTLCPPPLTSPPNSVILSEARNAQSKDPERSDAATTSYTFLAAEPSSTTPHDRDLFASDVLRYFLLREIPFGQDGSFSFDALITRYNADLANGYGNLVSRTLKMISDYFDGVIPLPQLMRPLDRTVMPEWWVSDPLAGRAEFNPDPFLQSNPDPLLQCRYISIRDANKQVGLSLDTELVVHGGKYFYPVNEGLNTWEFFQVAIDPLLRLANESSWTKNLTRVIEFIAEQIRAVDEFLSLSKPWKLLAEDTRRLHILGVAVEYIRIITALLYPILPYATARVWAQLGLGDIEQAARNGELKNLEWGGLKPGTKLGPLGPIFPRADKGLAQIMIDMENQNTPPLTTKNEQLTTDSTDPAAPPRTTSLPESGGPLTVGGSSAHTSGPHTTPLNTEIPASGIFANQPIPPTTDTAPSTTPQITIDDFAKIELRVAQILVAERIPKADKLLRLEVDLGPHGKRQILSGIAEWYTPEDLIGRRIVVITNLAPRKMRGLESHGMLLAASEGENGKPVLATFGEDIALGSRLK